MSLIATRRFAIRPRRPCRLRPGGVGGGGHERQPETSSVDARLLVRLELGQECLGLTSINCRALSAERYDDRIVTSVTPPLVVTASSQKVTRNLLVPALFAGKKVELRKTARSESCHIFTGSYASLRC